MLALIVVGAGWQSGWLWPVERFHIRDGRTFRVVATGVGTNLAAPADGWHRLGIWASRWVDLPKWVPLDRTPLPRFASPHPRLGIWIAEEFPASTERVGSRHFFDASPAFNQAEPAGYCDQRYSSDNWDFVLLLHHFPRRMPTFDLGLRAPPSIGRNPMEKLRVVNPKPFRGPTWLPENLPAMRQSNGMTFRLLDATTTGSGFTTKEGDRMIHRYTAMAWDNGNLPDHPVQVFDCMLSDPGGNRIRWVESDGSRTNTRISLAGGLFFDEPAWRLEVAVNTRPDGPPVEIVHSPPLLITPITPPPADEDAAIDLKPVYIQPPEVSFQGVSVPEATFSRVRVSEWNEDRPNRLSLSYEIPDLPMGTRINLASVQDDLGQVWRVDASQHSSSPMPEDASGGSRSCWVELSAESTQVTQPRHLNAVFEIRQDTVLRFHVAPRFKSERLEDHELPWPLQPQPAGNPPGHKKAG